jgi:mRNA interferase MazF
LGIVEITRGDVVLIVVPSDLGRPRPGIVVQATELTTDLSTILVCPVSSDLQAGLSLRPLIEVTPENGLRLRSQIMTDKLVALRRDRIRRVIGRIDAETSEQLDRALLLILGLAR